MHKEVEFYPLSEGPELKNISAHKVELDKIFLELLQRRETFVGSGKAAEVFHSKVNPNICYKIIKNPLTNPEYKNNVRREARLTDQLHGLEVSGARTPILYFSYIETNEPDNDEAQTPAGIFSEFHAICMEKLDAISVRNLLDGQGELPEGFDADNFAQALSNFITTMHATAGLHHRDLHDGNVMIDNTTGNPRIIDFGDATLSFSDNENEIYLETEIGRPAVRYTTDLDNVAQIRKTLKDYRVNRNRQTPAAIDAAA